MRDSQEPPDATAQTELASKCGLLCTLGEENIDRLVCFCCAFAGECESRRSFDGEASTVEVTLPSNRDVLDDFAAWIGMLLSQLVGPAKAHHLSSSIGNERAARCHRPSQPSRHCSRNSWASKRRTLV
eukprot:4986989-Amphidinium_carterae.1